MSITYWQGPIRLVGDVGACGEAAALPQDEVTAAVVLAAIVARNFASAPGWYHARVEGADGATVLVDEDDERVVMARGLLGGTAVRQGMFPMSLEQLRAALLTASEQRGDGGDGAPVTPVGDPEPCAADSNCASVSGARGWLVDES